MRRTPTFLALTVTLLNLSAAPTAAQSTAPPTTERNSLWQNLVGDVKHLPQRSNMYWLAGGTALAFAVHQKDSEINQYFIDHNSGDGFFKPGKYIGNGAVVVAGAFATYLAGRSMGMPRVRHIGMDEIEGTILALGITTAAKAAFRRERPPDPDGTQASGYSLPSGHAALTFTAATILQRHLGYKAGIPSYAVASYVAISRLHDHNHYASDVVAGATAGIIIGRSVTYHGRTFWGGPAIVPGGVMLVLATR